MYATTLALCLMASVIIAGIAQCTGANTQVSSLDHGSVNRTVVVAHE